MSLELWGIALKLNPRAAQMEPAVSSVLTDHPPLLTATCSLLKAEHVADLHEKLAAIVDVRAGSVRDISGASGDTWDHAEILQVAVVPDVDGGAGMDQVRDQKIGVELAGCWEICIGRADASGTGEERVVLQNDASGKLGSELPVPLAAQDMVVEDAAAGAGTLGSCKQVSALVRAKAFEQVRVFNFQWLDGPNYEAGLGYILPGQIGMAIRIRDGIHRTWRRYKVHSTPPEIAGEDRDFLEIPGLELRSAEVFVIVLAGQKH
jgi:hypothetical protein